MSEEDVSAGESWDCLVVGAGLSGLLAARRIQRAGYRVVVIDKGRQVGGRMASRRIGAARFDHGAQFFTCRTPEFSAVVREWQEAGVAEQWCLGFGSEQDGHPRYRGCPGMTEGPKLLARGLQIRLRTRAKAVVAGQGAWEILAESGPRLRARILVISSPVPQALSLLDAGGVTLPTQARATLEQVRYDRCVAVLARLGGATAIPEPGAVQVNGPVLQWLADNAAKGISPEPCVTLHASPGFSLESWDHDDEEVVSRMLGAAQGWLRSPVLGTQVHRWRYAMPAPAISERLVSSSRPYPIVFCGDAFGGPRVEGAALSGLAAGRWGADALASQALCV